MKIELIHSSEENPKEGYYEFYPGAYDAHYCRSKSVFIDVDTIEFIVDVFVRDIVGFNPYGPTTVSGTRLRHLATALKDHGKRVSLTNDPRDLKVESSLLEEYPELVQNWPEARRKISQLIRDLSRWLMAAHAKGEPVTIFGI